MINRIDSHSNDKIKTAKKLSSSSRFRNERQEFFLEGARLCYDAVTSGVRIKQLFYSRNAEEKYAQRLEKIILSADEAYVISNDVALRLAQTQSAQGVFAVCEMPKRNHLEVDVGGRYIFLENIQDPSNLGAIARTAEALGIDGAMLCSCCDVYNPKAQRASMGSLLRLPLFFSDNAVQTLGELKDKGMIILATTPDPQAQSITELELKEGVVAVVGNEGNGVTSETMSICQRATIPMKGRAESLNASMAAALVMWEMMR